MFCISLLSFTEMTPSVAFLCIEPYMMLQTAMLWDTCCTWESFNITVCLLILCRSISCIKWSHLLFFVLIVNYQLLVLSVFPCGKELFALNPSFLPHEMSDRRTGCRNGCLKTWEETGTVGLTHFHAKQSQHNFLLQKSCLKQQCWIMRAPWLDCIPFIVQYANLQIVTIPAINNV